MTVVRWYERGRSAALAARWLHAARHLPEAVPVRFGDSEPLRTRFDATGESGLTAALQQADSLLFLQCTRPIEHASLAAPTVPSYWGSYGAHSMTTTLSATDERLQRFALAFVGPDTVYVSASETEPYLAPRGIWHGPPTQRPDWFWLCPKYSRRLHGDWLPPQWCARLDEVEPGRRRAARIPWGLR